MKNKLSIALTLAVVMAMLVTSLAVADNLKDDVVVGGNDSFTAGGSTTIKYWIQSTGQGTGPNGCDAADGSSATVTINVPSGVTANPSSLTFSACNTSNESNPNNTQSVAFSSSTPGNYNITASVNDTNGTYNTSNASFTLHVLAPADTTPPVITPNASGTLGSNGWYVSDVNVSWTVSDPESLYTINSGCETTLVNYDTAGVTLGCSATSAGGTSEQSVIIKRDATAPTISGSASPSANFNGWNNTDVNVAFSCSDAMSGIASCGPDQTLSGEGTSQSVTGTAADNAGNSASATVGGINIDKTPPTITLNGGPADGASYYFGFVPPAPTEQDILVSDALSGPDLIGLSGYSDEVGTHKILITAYDKAGNVSTLSRTYTVLAWTLKGFYQPVDLGGVFNVVKGGSTVPLKFEVFAASELTSTSVIKSFVQTKIACDGSLPTDEIEVTTTGGTSLRYDATAGQFIQNWQTPKFPGQCYRVTMTTQDNSSLTAFFKLK